MSTTDYSEAYVVMLSTGKYYVTGNWTVCSTTKLSEAKLFSRAGTAQGIATSLKNKTKLPASNGLHPWGDPSPVVYLVDITISIKE